MSPYLKRLTINDKLIKAFKEITAVDVDMGNGRIKSGVKPAGMLKSAMDQFQAIIHIIQYQRSKCSIADQLKILQESVEKLIHCSFTVATYMMSASAVSQGALRITSITSEDISPKSVPKTLLQSRLIVLSHQLDASRPLYGATPSTIEGGASSATLPGAVPSLKLSTSSEEDALDPVVVLQENLASFQRLRVSKDSGIYSGFQQEHIACHSEFCDAIQAVGKLRIDLHMLDQLLKMGGDLLAVFFLSRRITYLLDLLRKAVGEMSNRQSALLTVAEAHYGALLPEDKNVEWSTNYREMMNRLTDHPEERAANELRASMEMIRLILSQWQENPLRQLKKLQDHLIAFDETLIATGKRMGVPLPEGYHANIPSSCTVLLDGVKGLSDPRSAHAENTVAGQAQPKSMQTIELLLTDYAKTHGYQFNVAGVHQTIQWNEALPLAGRICLTMKAHHDNKHHHRAEWIAACFDVLFEAGCTEIERLTQLLVHIDKIDHNLLGLDAHFGQLSGMSKCITNMKTTIVKRLELIHRAEKRTRSQQPRLLSIPDNASVDSRVSMGSDAVSSLDDSASSRADRRQSDLSSVPSHLGPLPAVEEETSQADPVRELVKKLTQYAEDHGYRFNLATVDEDIQWNEASGLKLRGRVCLTTTRYSNEMHYLRAEWIAVCFEVLGSTKPEQTRLTTLWDHLLSADASGLRLFKLTGSPTDLLVMLQEVRTLAKARLTVLQDHGQSTTNLLSSGQTSVVSEDEQAVNPDPVSAPITIVPSVSMPGSISTVPVVPRSILTPGSAVDHPLQSGQHSAVSTGGISLATALQEAQAGKVPEVMVSGSINHAPYVGIVEEIASWVTHYADKADSRQRATFLDFWKPLYLLKKLPILQTFHQYRRTAYVLTQEISFLEAEEADKESRLHDMTVKRLEEQAGKTKKSGEVVLKAEKDSIDAKQKKAKNEENKQLHRLMEEKKPVSHSFPLWSTEVRINLETFYKKMSTTSGFTTSSRSDRAHDFLDAIAQRLLQKDQTEALNESFDRLLTVVFTRHLEEANDEKRAFYLEIAHGLMVLGANPLPWMQKQTRSTESGVASSHAAAYFLMAAQVELIIAHLSYRAQRLGESMLFVGPQCEALLMSFKTFAERLKKCVESDDHFPWCFFKTHFEKHNGGRYQRAALLWAGLQYVYTIINDQLFIRCSEENKTKQTDDFQKASQYFDETIKWHREAVKDESRIYNTGLKIVITLASDFQKLGNAIVKNLTERRGIQDLEGKKKKAEIEAQAAQAQAQLAAEERKAAELRAGTEARERQAAELRAGTAELRAGTAEQHLLHSPYAAVFSNCNSLNII